MVQLPLRHTLVVCPVLHHDCDQLGQAPHQLACTGLDALLARHRQGAGLSTPPPITRTTTKNAAEDAISLRSVLCTWYFPQVNLYIGTGAVHDDSRCGGRKLSSALVGVEAAHNLHILWFRGA